MPFKKGETPKGAKVFKKGESGNLNGRPKKLPKLDELLASVLGEEKDGITAAEFILKKLRQRAMSGDVKAIELLMDRAYGKSKQTTEITLVEQPLFPIEETGVRLIENNAKNLEK